jgi:hypothetical protein
MAVLKYVSAIPNFIDFCSFLKGINNCHGVEGFLHI